jgi:integrase
MVIFDLHAAIRIKLLTGLRRGDLLRLRVSDLHEDGIRVDTHKTGKPIIYEWSPELKRAVEEAKGARPINIAPLLFCNKRGQGYINETTGNVYGWNSMWQRFMKRVMAETKVTERFTEHDLRAKCASDAKTLEHARALLAHADSRITERVYRRKPERVQPLR